MSESLKSPGVTMIYACVCLCVCVCVCASDTNDNFHFKCRYVCGLNSITISATSWVGSLMLWDCVHKSDLECKNSYYMICIMPVYIFVHCYTLCLLVILESYILYTEDFLYYA